MKFERKNYCQIVYGNGNYEDYSQSIRCTSYDLWIIVTSKLQICCHLVINACRLERIKKIDFLSEPSFNIKIGHDVIV